MNKIEIKDLNNLNQYENLGLFNQEILLSNEKYNLVCDYLQKINYALQDIEKELTKTPDNSVLISILVYICWIQESVDEIQKTYDSRIFQNINYDTSHLNKNKKFLNALRSFIFAHPFTTNRHSLYGFDGTLRCIDIRPNTTSSFSAFWNSDDKKYIDKNGLYLYADQQVDYWLYVYNSKKYNNQFYQYIGISLKSICDIANEYINYIYFLDKYLNNYFLTTEDK